MRFGRSENKHLLNEKKQELHFFRLLCSHFHLLLTILDYFRLLQTTLDYLELLLNKTTPRIVFTKSKLIMNKINLNIKPEYNVFN